jgi:DNA-binding transcriptional regulator YhcF (GntR family)
MDWNIDKNRPICPQIGEQICVEIASGNLKPNERLMSVREMALAAGVNPNTVQRAFEQLETSGLIYSVRSSGWFVAEDTSLALDTVKGLVQQKTQEYMENLMHLGLTCDEIKQYVKEWKV